MYKTKNEKIKVNEYTRCLKCVLLCAVLALMCVLGGCGNETSTTQTGQTDTHEGSQNIAGVDAAEPAEDAAETAADAQEENVDSEMTDTEILVAYFTRLPNTESGDDLDAVVQGGGPYGAIGENFAEADLDAIASASITVTEDGVRGNVEAMAEWIAEHTGGDLFSIETVQKYPLDYDTLIDQGGEEQQNSERPELSSHVENMEDYSVIFLGYPNWYYDMPMALYSFLEEYDLSGKIIIPFAASAGSGLSNTVARIAELQPEAEVLRDALALRMGDVKNSESVVIEWVEGLEIMSDMIENES